ncbi:hypothetical protein GQ600_5973 [Phytophthora cactorum]|nr:hypothetical protein GQ600_5973 [Phytophthora cactorum]
MNHDVNFLSAGEGTVINEVLSTEICCNVFGEPARNSHARLHKAVSKRGDASDAILEGRRLVQSMCCTLSKPQEVSGPMTALFLLRESPFYSSCSFEKLFLGSIATVVFEGEAVDVMLHAAGSGATSQPSSPLLDYIQRPDELANTNEQNNWDDGFSLSKRSRAVRQSERGDPLVTFRRSMLLLFRPFRNKFDLVPVEQSLEESYCVWWQSPAALQARNFENNAMDYYASRELASARVDEDMLRYSEYGDTLTNTSIDEECLDFEEVEPGDLYIAGEEDGVDDLFPGILEYNISNISLIPNALESLPPIALHIRRATGKQIVRLLASILPERPRGVELQRASSGFIEMDLPTRVQILRDAWRDNEWVDPSTIAPSAPGAIPDHASLPAVAARFRLNRKQHKFFFLAGQILLKSLTADSACGPEQLVGFLGGLSGSGKSQDVAAQAANGQTLHKFFGWGIHARNTKQRYSVQQRERFAKLRMLTIDEYLDRIRGHCAYCAVNYVVILDENMHHRNDPEWKEILRRWRVGHYLESDIETVNTTCFHKNWSDELHAGGTNTYCPIIVTSNALRSEFNHECAVEFCRKRQQILHKFLALVTRAKRSALAPTPLRHATRRSPQKSSFYVAVTRVITMRELILTEKLTLEYLEYFTPEASALAETHRLLSLKFNQA